MSDGPQCCAIGVCCPDAVSRPKRAKMLADAMGVDESKGHALLDWMDAEEIAFAPASFRAVVADIVSAVRSHPEQS